jgi:hypothetical protein
MSQSIVDRLRPHINQSLKSARHTALGLLPHEHAEHSATYLQGQRMAANMIGTPESMVRPSTGFVKMFDGDLTIDPASRALFRGKTRLVGSSDLIGREREPSVWAYVKAPAQRSDAVWNIRGAYENNYYHFVWDTVLSYRHCKPFIPVGTPIVIGEALARQPFFKHARELGFMKNETLIVQSPREPIAARRVYVGAPPWPSRDDLIAIAGQFQQPDRNGPQRVYIRRGPNSNNGRTIRNDADVMELLERNGFTAVDPQTLTFQDQVALFQGASVVVSPHGAGVTNIMWRGGRPLHVIELMNPTFNVDCYQQMSNILGYSYTRVMNKSTQGSRFRGSSEVDLAALERAVRGLN